jgi:GT2 family glycosyltransferase
MVDPLTKTLTYGGRCKGKGINPLNMGSILKPAEEPIKCDFINGNLTLIPINTVEKIGLLSDRFTHSMGDFDYGLRAAMAGLSCWVAPGIYGECEANPIKGSWQDMTLDINVRITKMKSISQLPPVNEWSYFVRQHGGTFWPLLYLDARLRGHLPKLWLILQRFRK